jgi:hypothetical protein
VWWSEGHRGKVHKVGQYTCYNSITEPLQMAADEELKLNGKRVFEGNSSCSLSWQEPTDTVAGQWTFVLFVVSWFQQHKQQLQSWNDCGAQFCGDSYCQRLDAFMVTEEAEQSFVLLLLFCDRPGESPVKRVRTQQTQNCVMQDWCGDSLCTAIMYRQFTFLVRSLDIAFLKWWWLLIFCRTLLSHFLKSKIKFL